MRNDILVKLVRVSNLWNELYKVDTNNNSVPQTASHHSGDITENLPDLTNYNFQIEG